MVPRLLKFSRSLGAFSVAGLLLAVACGGGGGDAATGGTSTGGAGTGGSSAGLETRSSVARVLTPSVTTDDAATLATDNAAFAVDLYQVLRARPGNLVFSPTSVSIALAMTYAGAVGETAAQMAQALHFTLPPAQLHPAFDALDLALASRRAGAGTFDLRMANALWAQQGLPLEMPFLDLLAADYGSGVRRVDFAAAETARAAINQWVSDATQARIPELLQPQDIDANTALYLTNAVWFQADWASPFAPDSREGTFHAPAGDVSVPLMSGQGAARLWQGEGYHAAALSYAGQAVSFVVLVPDAGTFSDFEATFTAGALQAILGQAPAGAPQDGLVLPRFSFGTGTNLKDALKALGVIDAFDVIKADFSGVDGARDLYVSKVLHQATIAVDEKGTEASAATAVGLGVRGALPAQTLTVDRPFLFFIRDDATGALLFAGRVLDPSVKG